MAIQNTVAWLLICVDTNLHHLKKKVLIIEMTRVTASWRSCVSLLPFVLDGRMWMTDFFFMPISFQCVFLSCKLMASIVAMLEVGFLMWTLLWLKPRKKDICIFTEPPCSPSFFLPVSTTSSQHLFPSSNKPHYQKLRFIYYGEKMKNK